MEEEPLDLTVAAEILFDIASCALRSSDPCAFARPCPPVSRRALQDRHLYLAVRYDECDARPVRVPPGGCGCDEVACEYARTRDGYELCCLSDVPETHFATMPDCDALDRGTILPFEPCPSPGSCSRPSRCRNRRRNRSAGSTSIPSPTAAC